MLKIQENSLFYNNKKVKYVKIGLKIQEQESFENGESFDEPFQIFFLYHIIKNSICYVVLEDGECVTESPLRILSTYLEFMNKNA